MTYIYTAVVTCKARNSVNLQALDGALSPLSEIKSILVSSIHLINLSLAPYIAVLLHTESVERTANLRLVMLIENIVTEHIERCAILISMALSHAPRAGVRNLSSSLSHSYEY